MAADQTYLRRMGAARRIGRGLLALLFLGAGIALSLTVLVIAAVNIAPLRHALLDFGLRNIESEEMQIAIGDISGDWPRRLVIEDLRLGDAQGEWLTLARLELDWRPLALWRGEVHVERFASEELFLLRVPEGGAEEAATDTGFSLPLLPVDIAIDRFELAGTHLGEALAGETVTFDASGAAALGRSHNALTLDAARTATRPVWFDGWRETPVYWRDHLPLPARIVGPAIVEQMDTTTLVPPGVAVRVDDLYNLILELPK